jgi:hypothetical protein
VAVVVAHAVPDAEALCECTEGVAVVDPVAHAEAEGVVEPHGVAELVGQPLAV